MLTVRPKVAELVFQLYGRALHPELFQVHSTRTVKRGDYEATVNITSAGHVVTWRYRADADRSRHQRPSSAAAETAADLLSAERAGQRSGRVSRRRPLQRQFSAGAGRARGVLDLSARAGLRRRAPGHALPLRFQRPHGPGRLSYINLEARNRSLLVQAFHTFPDDYAIVKSQSLFEIP